jgi:hypothetical protein
MAKRAVIPNQVFIGCPWKTIRPKYDRLIDRLNKRFPLSFILVGREEDQSAEDLLTVIKTKLLGSSYAIFDVTAGNANVSLEFGIADTSEIGAALYLNVHGANKKTSADSAIISDLAGKRRKHYKNEAGLENLLTSFSKSPPYTKRFEAALLRGLKSKTKGNKKRLRALALKRIHYVDDKEKVRRDDLVQEMQVIQPPYKESEIQDVLSILKDGEIIQVTPGRYSDILIS